MPRDRRLILTGMAKKGTIAAPAGKPSALLDTRVIYCGDCVAQLRKLVVRAACP
jgi:hypothetical protein